MPAILTVAPGFKSRWEKHLKSWAGEPAGIYNDIAEFAHYVVDSYDTNQTAWYHGFFDLIERMIAVGNEHMKELATIGFLEDIQTISSWKPHKGQIFVQYLGPKSKEAWVSIDELWRKHGGSLANIIRAENRQPNP
ncbi:MAG: hypothetical protein Q7R34_01980 [Dehalococcoidia bacterium]|nr:hypothetical protein [Dehalococcoidia bacterium]